MKSLVNGCPVYIFLDFQTHFYEHGFRGRVPDWFVYIDDNEENNNQKKRNKNTSSSKSAKR